MVYSKAKYKKEYIIAEELILPAAGGMSNIIFNRFARKLLSEVPLTIIISRRIPYVDEP